MSHTLELLSEVQHGTPAGYRAGCHGSAASCGGVVSCATVYVRYQGDWGFRKRVDAGEDPTSIILAEAAELEAVRVRDREAARRAVKPAKAPKRVKQESGPRRAVVFERLRDDVIRLHAQGLTDAAIGRELGVGASTIQYVRGDKLGLPRNLKPKPVKVLSPREQRKQRVRELHAQGATDRDIAEALGLTVPAANQLRRRLHLPVHPADRSLWAASMANRESRRPEVRRLHALGWSDARIATEIGVSKSRVGELRRLMQLPAVGRPGRRGGAT